MINLVDQNALGQVRRNRDYLHGPMAATAIYSPNSALYPPHAEGSCAAYVELGMGVKSVGARTSSLADRGCLRDDDGRELRTPITVLLLAVVWSPSYLRVG